MKKSAKFMAAAVVIAGAALTAIGVNAGENDEIKGKGTRL